MHVYTCVRLHVCVYSVKNSIIPSILNNFIYIHVFEKMKSSLLTELLIMIKVKEGKQVLIQCIKPSSTRLHVPVDIMANAD